MRHPDLMRSEGLQQFRYTKKSSLHVLWQREQFLLHRLVENINGPFRHVAS